MKIPDCYFFVNEDLPEEERVVSAMHVQCRNEKMPGAGWFYLGSENGYGPFEFNCSICGEIIYNGENSNEEDKESETI